MDNITFCREMPNFSDGSMIYYFVTFRIDESKPNREISNINIVIFSYLDYIETIDEIRDKSNKEKFDIYVRNILEKLDISYENAEWTAQFIGISSRKIIEKRLFDYKKMIQ